MVVTGKQAQPPCAWAGPVLRHNHNGLRLLEAWWGTSVSCVPVVGLGLYRNANLLYVDGSVRGCQD